MLSYCKKCGRILHNVLKLQEKCDICGSVAYEVPNEYVDNFRWRDGDGRQALIEELVKTSPEFDQYLFEHRDEILAKKNMEYERAIAHGKAILEGKSRKVTCPYCQSTSVSRIGLLNRIVSVELWGLASSKISKQWRCNDCGSEF